ncbi:MAG: tRNA 4-thiouridine(8) synthase ThiI [Deltaproteobacteria bacterium]|nr:tRNA 4-thiouridine(8) synthase ThiI [Deltaproteobacteria bacterium]
MVSHSKKIRALGICSGGLDSMLSAVVLREQGIDVEWINFETPFFSSEKAREASKQIKIPLRVKEITDEYLQMLKNPPRGFGKNMNPCMDCHALMFKIAGEMMKEENFDFLFSGEVVGQRPMSQTKPSLRYVEKTSGFVGYIVRPLSAKNLPETIPEKEGFVDRSQLLGFSGRSRKPQIALAKEYGITDYPAPAGGCLLTDKGFSDRLKDLFEHQESFTKNEIHLLKHGRHIRLKSGEKIIIGRTKDDNESITQYYDPKKDTLIKIKGSPGPIVLIPQAAGENSVKFGAALCIGYSKVSNVEPTDVLIVTPKGKETVQVLGISSSDIKQLLI